jgi:ACS family tartrate transporter-like MFS transporter
VLGGLKGWHWLFIIEGLPAVLLGFAALKLLPDRPAGAPWLSEDEKHALETKLAAEAETTRDAGYHARPSRASSCSHCSIFCIVVGLYGIGFWMPQVIQTFGLAPLEIGFLTAVPYLFASIAMVLWGGTPTSPASVCGTWRSRSFLPAQLSPGRQQACRSR